MIDLRKLRELVELMVANDLTELDVQGKDDRVTLKRFSASQAVQYISPPIPATAVGPGGAVGNQAIHQANGQSIPAAASGGGEADGGDASNTIKITSPMVGTFYAAPSPDAQPFVKIGDKVEPDTVVCIIEAMKVFNEIKSEVTGTITKVLVDTSQAVEFGQALYEVKPS